LYTTMIVPAGTASQAETFRNTTRVGKERPKYPSRSTSRKPRRSTVEQGPVPTTRSSTHSPFPALPCPNSLMTTVRSSCPRAAGPRRLATATTKRVTSQAPCRFLASTPAGVALL